MFSVVLIRFVVGLPYLVVCFFVAPRVMLKVIGLSIGLLKL